MAVVHGTGRPAEERDAIGQTAADLCAGRAAERMVLLTVAAVAAAEAALLAWLIR